MIKRIWGRTGYRQLLWWTILLAWMGVIFLMSGQEGEDSAQLSGGIVNAVVNVLMTFVGDMDPEDLSVLQDTLHVLIRKTAHFTEYAILSGIGVELFRSYGCVTLRYSWIAWLGATIYAMTDEWHQGYTPGRASRFFDVCIDSAGALFGVLVLAVYFYIRSKKKRIDERCK